MRRALAAVGLAILAGCGPKGDTKTTGPSGELPTVTVTAAPVTARPLQRTVDAVGTLAGYEETTIAPKVSGRVLAAYYDLGDVVLPGTVLLELDPIDHLNEVDRARRALDLELARLALPELRTKSQFRIEDVPAVRKAQYALENAQKEHDRVTSLGGASGRERDAAITDLRLAQATKSLALAEANAGLTAAWLRRDELGAAELRLADCTLRAPFPSLCAAWAAIVTPGFTPFRYSVARKLVSEGEVVQSQPKTDAYQLVIDRALKLPVGVPEKFVGEVRLGQPVEVRVDAFPGRVFPGVVYRISATVDPVNRTFYPVVAIMNLDRELKAGGFARASILTRIDPAVKTVPPAAVVTFAGVNKVFVIEGGRAKAVEVRLGTRDKDWVEVIGELTAGATVATSGHSQLVDGSPVKLRE